MRSSTPAADHGPDAIVTLQERLPAIAVVLSHAVPATSSLDDPVSAASRKVPAPAEGMPALPELDVTATSQSFGSPVVMVKPGVALVPLAVPVIPIAVTPEYSSAVKLYCVVSVKLGVTFVSVAQSRQIRMAEQDVAPQTCAYGKK